MRILGRSKRSQTKRLGVIGGLLVISLLIAVLGTPKLVAGAPNGNDRGVLILCFHEIGSAGLKAPSAQKALYLPPLAFEKIVRYLKQNGYTFMTLSQVHDQWASDKDLPNKTVAITFDDGYESVYTYALPIAKKYKVPFTDFIIAGDVNVPGHLTEEQLRDMLSTGLVEIGSHTFDHYNLKYLSREEQEKQISSSIQYLERILPGYKITSFALPYGQYNDETKEALAKYGITMDVTTQFGIAHKGDDWLLLPRVYINALPAYVYYRLGTEMITRRIENIMAGKLTGEADGPPACALFEDRFVNCDQVISFVGGKAPYQVRVISRTPSVIPDLTLTTTKNYVLVPFSPTEELAKSSGTHYSFSFTVTDAKGAIINGQKEITLVSPLSVKFVNAPEEVYTTRNTVTFTVDTRSDTSSIADFFNKPTGYPPLIIQWLLDGKQIIPAKTLVDIGKETIDIPESGVHVVSVKVKDSMGQVATASKTVYITAPTPFWPDRHLFIRL